MGEFLILIGAFQVHWVWGALAVPGIVLGAAYMLWLYQRTMFGEITKEENKALPDLSVREIATLIPIVAFCFWIGLYPAPFLKAMEASVANVIETVEKGNAGKPVQGKKTAGSSGGSAVRQFGGSAELIAQLPNRPIAGPHEGGR